MSTVDLLSSFPAADAVVFKGDRCDYRGKIVDEKMVFDCKVDEVLSQFGGKRVSIATVDKYPGCDLPLEARVLRQIVEEENPDMPIMMVDVERILSQWNRWVRLIPRALPYYPVKCNDDPVLLRALALLGSKFDCASPAEMMNILSIGCQPSDIIYSNPCKQVSSLQFARSREITLTVFDNFDELYKIAEHFPEAELLMRIRTDDTNAQCPMSAKFGAGPESWADLLATAKDLGLSIIGVDFHVGSGCQSIGAFVQAIESAADVFKMGSALGFSMSLLDIGGGFPGDFQDDDPRGKPIQFDEIARAVTPLIDKLFPSDVKVISEPGRYFATTSHTLAVKVFSRRVPPKLARMEQRDKREEGRSRNEVDLGKTCLDIGEEWKDYQGNSPNPNILYYINDGLYGSFNCVLYDHAVITPEILKSGKCGERDERSLFPSTVFGQTCDGFDCIIKSVLLPKLEVGDWLVFRNMGAYTVAAASSFNGFSKPCTRYVRILSDE